MWVNFVTEPEQNKWILGRWCDEWVKHMPEATITSRTLLDADVNIFCNYALFDVEGYYGKAISIFTHRELEDWNLQQKFDAVALQSDWCVAQSKVTAKMLPAEKTTIIHPSVGSRFLLGRPLRIGVVGRDYRSGRKRFDWLEELRKIDGIEIKHADSVPYETMPSFYKEIDYLLTTAENEGGPMPVVEALALGKPVIAPVGVGWCDEYTTIKYDNTLNDLSRVIRGLIVREDGWEVGAKKLLSICRFLTDRKFNKNSSEK